MQQTLDTVLLLRAQAGDATALEELVNRHDGPLRYFIRRLLADTSAADDIAQEAWLAAIRQIKRITCGAAFRVWLYRVARNMAVSLLRKQGCVAALPMEAAADVPEEEETVFSAEDVAAVHSAIARLTIEHRAVITLRFLEDMSYEEIAAVVDCTTGTVRSRLHYAKKELRRIIGADGNIRPPLCQNRAISEEQEHERSEFVVK